MIARKITKKSFSLRIYLAKPSHGKLIDYGERYFIDGPFRGKALIKLFGPKTYWRKDVEGVGTIFGEAFDPSDKEILHEILDSRRAGDIYGKWYSGFCPEGEIGYLHYRRAELIGSEEFEVLMQGV